MKYLPAFLLIGSLLSPAWSQEVGIKPEEFAEIEAFIEKLGKAKPWTLEKIESELGAKFTYTSSTGVIKRYTAYELLPSVQDIIIQYISIRFRKSDNKSLNIKKINTYIKL